MSQRNQISMSYEDMAVLLETARNAGTVDHWCEAMLHWAKSVTVAYITLENSYLKLVNDRLQDTMAVALMDSRMALRLIPTLEQAYRRAIVRADGGASNASNNTATGLSDIS